MIDLYTFGTSNGQRVAIALEETGFPYKVHKVDLQKGEQKRSEYLEINPTGRIPAIVDNDGPGGTPMVLTQSFAISIYLAERSGRLLPTDPRSRVRCLEWLMFVITDVSAPVGQAFFLNRLAKEAHPAAAAALRERGLGFVEHLDRRLGDTPFLGGDAYTIADIAAYPTVVSIDEPDRRRFANLSRWTAEVGARPAVARGMAVAAME
jgi:GSH-dependent disulfide-bond oxidoreductase